MSDLQEIREKATQYGWKEICFQTDIGMLSFRKQDTRINIYTTKMTVATCLTHPKKGKTQLFRKNVELDLLERIFKNPRLHTRLGYYTRKKTN